MPSEPKTAYSSSERAALKDTVLSTLNALRSVFPLERRIAQTTHEARSFYAQVLASWLRGETPSTSMLPPDTLRTLSELDAIVADINGISCYPFNARERGILVQFGSHTAQAMCAVDALAIARLAGATARISAACCHCQRPVACEVQSDGSLNHEQTDVARVIWQHAVHGTGSCSENLCRDLNFLCNECPIPTDATVLTLAQATAVGNAFFSFQRRLLSASATG